MSLARVSVQTRNSTRCGSTVFLRLPFRATEKSLPSINLFLEKFLTNRKHGSTLISGIKCNHLSDLRGFSVRHRSCPFCPSSFAIADLLTALITQGVRLIHCLALAAPIKVAISREQPNTEGSDTLRGPTERLFGLIIHRDCSHF